MSGSLGEAVLDLTADDSLLTKGIEGAKNNALKALGGLSDFGGMIVKAGAVAAIAGTTILVKGLYDCVQAAMESQTVQTQLNTVLESTKGIAGVSADAVNKYSDAMSLKTGIDREAITSAQSMLLTFTDVGKKIFPDATTAILDMATAMNGGITPSAEELRNQTIQLGKALQDPDAGLGALKRVGVNVDELEKKFTPLMSKEEKQKLILKELQTEFGGSAEAAGKTFPGQLKILEVQFKDMQEMIGNKLLPVLSNFFSYLSEYLSRPENQAMLENLANGIANFAKQAIENLPKVIQAFKDAFTWLQNNQGVIVAVLAVLGAAIAAFAITTLVPLLPVIAVIALIGGAAYLLYQAWTTNFGGIQEKTAAVWAWLQPILQNIWNWLSVNIPIAIQALSNFWTNTLVPATQTAWAFIQNVIGGVMQFISDLTGGKLGAVSDMWNRTWSTISLYLSTWVTTVMLLFHAFTSAFNGDWYSFGVYLRTAWDLAWGMLVVIIQTGFANIGSQLSLLWKSIVNYFNTINWGDVGMNIVKGIAQGLLGALPLIIKAAQTVGKAALDAIKGFLGIKSPSSVFEMQVGWQMAAGVEKGWNNGLANMNVPGISTPAIASGGGMALSGAGGMTNVQFVYQPFIGVNDEYEAEQKLRGIMERINRKNSNQ